MRDRSSLVRVRLLALGAAIYLIATLWAMHAAFGQTPQVSIEPRVQKDTIVQLTASNKPMVFGFSRVVMAITALPLTSPPRAYCVRATLKTDTLLVDPPLSDAEPIFPQCDRSQVPLVIRPVCQLTYEENLSWQVKRERPVIFVCSRDGEPVVVLLTKPGQP